MGISIGLPQYDEACVAVIYRDLEYDEDDKENRDKHEHVFIFSPKYAIEFANLLREYAKEAFAITATNELKAEENKEREIEINKIREETKRMIPENSPDSEINQK